jgi:hypothetical protein
MIDLSGGISESWDLKKMTQSDKDNFWTILYQSFNKDSMTVFSNVNHLQNYCFVNYNNVFKIFPFMDKG